MTTAQRLGILKQNIQTLTSAHDEFLTVLLTQAEAEVQIMGIRDDGSTLYDTIIIDFAAYKWRKRAANTSGGREGDTSMPRFLKRDINNLLFTQKIRGNE